MFPRFDGVYQIVRKNIKNKVYLARGKNILPLVPTLANINFTNSNEEGSILTSFTALGSLFKSNYGYIR